MTYDYAMGKKDFAIIDKLNALNDPAVFWDQVRKITSNVNGSHGLRRWQILAEARFNELTGRAAE